jgi:hypothetical protein
MSRSLRSTKVEIVCSRGFFHINSRTDNILSVDLFDVGNALYNELRIRNVGCRQRDSAAAIAATTFWVENKV